MITPCLMAPFHDSLISTAHVSAEYVPYYVGWVRQAYEITGERLTAAPSRAAEQKTLQELHGRCQSWQLNQARHTLAALLILPAWVHLGLATLWLTGFYPTDITRCTRSPKGPLLADLERCKIGRRSEYLGEAPGPYRRVLPPLRRWRPHHRR